MVELLMVLPDFFHHPNSSTCFFSTFRTMDLPDDEVDTSPFQNETLTVNMANQAR